MSKDLNDKIRRSRTLLENPYAYVSGFGEYEAVDSSSPRSIHDERRLLQNPYAYLNQDGTYSNWPRHDQALRTTPLIDPQSLLSIDTKTKGKSFSKSEIETVARRLQSQLWKKREKIWLNLNASPFDVLDPAAALQCLGYSVEFSESLGQFSELGEAFEVAGLFDRNASAVMISRRFPSEVRRFTIAHELAHALLHGEAILHRDRGMDGNRNPTRSRIEAEADLFASYFLLPEKLVRQTFAEMFLTQHFELNEHTAFALGAPRPEAIKHKFRTPRDLGRMLAATRSYNGTHFRSIAEQFQVSAETMAIRLEELRLV